MDTRLDSEASLWARCDLFLTAGWTALIGDPKSLLEVLPALDARQGKGLRKALKKTQKNTERTFLHGIVTAKASSQVICRLLEAVLFTSLSHHIGGASALAKQDIHGNTVFHLTTRAPVLKLMFRAFRRTYVFGFVNHQGQTPWDVYITKAQSLDMGIVERMKPSRVDVWGDDDLVTLRPGHHPGHDVPERREPLPPDHEHWPFLTEAHPGHISPMEIVRWLLSRDPGYLVLSPPLLNPGHGPELDPGKLPARLKAALHSYTPPLQDTIPPHVWNTVGESVLGSTRLFALDCEMVGVGPRGSQSRLARLSIVEESGRIVMDAWVKPQATIVDYRTRWSGVQPSHMSVAYDEKHIQTMAKALINQPNVVIVGHDLRQDLDVLKLRKSDLKCLFRDTARCPVIPLPDGSMPEPGTNIQPRKLKSIFQEQFAVSIQDGRDGHDSVEDARAALLVYLRHAREWEEHISTYGHY